MYIQNLWKLGFSVLKSLVLPFAIALLFVSVFSVSTYASGKPIPTSKPSHAGTNLIINGKTIPIPTSKLGHAGAELIVNGKVIQLTPVASAKTSMSLSPKATATCIVPVPSIDNVGFTPSYASFDVSTYVYNVCSAAIKSGKFNTRGYVTCQGVTYSNPPTESGSLPAITAGGYRNVRGPTQYYGICVSSAGDIYPPSVVTINSFVSGTLTNGTIFMGSSSAVAQVY